MSEARLFFSKTVKLRLHLNVLDKAGKLKVKKVARFEGGKYYALPKDDPRNELGVDEAELIRDSKYFGVMVYDREGWADLAKTKLKESESAVIEEIVREKETELLESLRHVWQCVGVVLGLLWGLFS